MGTEFLINADLDGDAFKLKGGNTGILMIHGFTATTAEVRQISTFLSHFGYTIHAPLLPGHGTTPRELNSIRYQDWITEIDQAYNSIKNQCQAIFVAGESMGAILSLHLAEIYPELRGVICYSPALIVKNLWLSMILRYFIDVIPKNSASDDLPWKGYTVNPVNASSELFKLQQVTKSKLARIHQPTCVFIGGKDERIAPDAGKFLLSKISSPIKELHYFDRSPHCMILGADMAAIGLKTHTFIQSCL